MAGGHALLQPDVLGVGDEGGRLVDVLHGDGDAGGVLLRRLDVAGQRHLVVDAHVQHEGTVLLVIHRLWCDRERKRGRWSKEIQVKDTGVGR